jgi:chemotaxis protein MotB
MSGGWVVIFADISALLLAFFVMIFTMSTLEIEKWRRIVSPTTSGDPSTVELRPAPTSSTSMPTVDVPPALPLGYLAQVLDEKLSEEELVGRVTVHRLDKMIVISLPSELIFEPGEATLTASARQALFRVSSALSQIGNQIDIQGYVGPPADDAPKSGWKWRLSMARAIAVADELKRIGYQGNPALMGLGDSRYRYLDSAIPEDKRLVLARRVDLVIYPTEGKS